MLIEPPTVRIEPTVEAKDEPLVQVDDAAADEAWDVASQEPVAWTGGAEEAAGQTKGADSPPEEAVSPTDESDSGSFELGDLPAEDALEVPAADAGPAPIVAPVVPSPESESADVASVSPPDVEQAPVESAPGQPGAPVEEGEEDELAVWLASVEIAEGRRPLRRPELEEVDRLLSAPEVSEALTEPSEPEAEPASQPRRSLFDTGPVVMPEPPTSETDVTAAPEPPEAPVSTAPSPPRDEPKPDRGTDADQAAADVSPMFQAADPSAAPGAALRAIKAGGRVCSRRDHIEIQVVLVGDRVRRPVRRWGKSNGQPAVGGRGDRRRDGSRVVTGRTAEADADTAVRAGTHSRHSRRIRRRLRPRVTAAGICTHRVSRHSTTCSGRRAG